jgi:hemin uptake protein HemP
METPKDRSPPDTKGATQQTQIIYKSTELLQGRNEAWIEHCGEM